MEKLLNGQSTAAEVERVVKDYPELKADRLYIQLSMLRQLSRSVSDNVSLSTVDNFVSFIKSLDLAVRRLFPQVEEFIKLLLTMPCSNAEAERSFSALRRLKTYLRSTMGQARLNHIAVLHVHQELVDNIDIQEAAEQFISKNESRMKVFGKP